MCQVDLHGLACLEELAVTSCKSLRSVNVANCAQLLRLRVDMCNVRDLQLAALPRLREVSADGCLLDHFGARGVPALEELVQLSVLWTNDARLELDAPSLRVLDLRSSPYLTSEKLQAVLACLPKLVVLSVSDCANLTHVNVPGTVVNLALRALPKLRHVAADGPLALRTLELAAVAKLEAADRQALLSAARASLEQLVLRGDVDQPALALAFPQLADLTVEQCLSLHELTVRCPRLRIFKLAGCLALHTLRLEHDAVDLQIHELSSASSVRHLALCASMLPPMDLLARLMPNLRHLELAICPVAPAELTRCAA